MGSHSDGKREKKKQLPLQEKSKAGPENVSVKQFADSRQEAVTQRKFRDMASHTAGASKWEQIQTLADNSTPTPSTVQKKGKSSNLPVQLKAGIEQISGYAMDDVKVHYNSDKPAQLQAHAYAQGSEIHLASGQEKHLAHEAWHVVQQKQGRVNPTAQLKARVNVNDDVGLEREADVMGAKAMQYGSRNSFRNDRVHSSNVSLRQAQGGAAVQRVKDQKEIHKAKIAKLNEHIAEANKEIEKLNKIKSAFQTDATFTPMNPAVFLGDMKTASEVPTDLAHSRLTNFSAKAKEYVNKTTKSNLTPEIQTAHVADALATAHSIYISGNSEAANKKIRPKAAQNLSQFYIEKLRPLNVEDRRVALRNSAKRDFKTKSARGGFISSIKVPKELLDKKGVKADDLQPLVVRALHGRNKRSDLRKAATSTRKFVKVHGAYPVKVPPNKAKIHAESAILKEIRKVSLNLKEISGTKVACLACLAYFTKLGEQDHLGKYTGYAWISQSSQAQLKELIASIDSVASYLVAIQNQLQSHLSSLRRYDGTGGEKKIGDMEEEADISDTDSEDEEAIGGLSDEHIMTLAKELYSAHFK